MQPFTFDPQKTIEVLLYISKRTPIPDIYRCLKILYFADKAHLADYGRFICGDSYSAMKHGPVPSGAYDIVKAARGSGYSELPVESLLKVKGNDIIPLRDADIDSLSESDTECLDAAIKEYGAMSFDEIKGRSHDDAYDSVDMNDMISIEAIVSTLEDGNTILSHLKG